MIRDILAWLRNIGWENNQSFWLDASLIILSFPFFIFPSRFPLITTILLIAFLFRWVGEIYYGPRAVRSPFTILILVFAGWLIIPILVSTEPDLTLEKAMGVFLGLVVLRFIIIYFYTDASLKLLLFITLVLGSAFTGIGFLAVDWLDKIPSISAIVNLFPQQVISFSAIGSGEGVQPNQLAGTLLWLIPFSVGMAIWLKEQSYRGWAFLVGTIASVFIVILIFSQSRGGWLGGVVAVGTFIWLSMFGLSRSHPLHRGTWLFPLLIIVSISVSIIVFSPNQLATLWIDPPDETLVGNLGTLSFRQEVWTWSFQGIRDFSVTGLGLGTFRRVVHQLYPITIPITYDIAHAHNIFLQVALDVGLPGLLIYILLLFVFFAKGIQLILNKSNYQFIAVGLLASFAGFHFYGLVDAVSLGAKPAILFWMLIGLMHLIYKVDSDKV